MAVTVKNVKLVTDEIRQAMIWALHRPENYGAAAAADTVEEAFFDLVCRADDPRGPDVGNAAEMIEALDLVIAAARAARRGYEMGVEMYREDGPELIRQIADERVDLEPPKRS